MENSNLKAGQRINENFTFPRKLSFCREILGWEKDAGNVWGQFVHKQSAQPPDTSKAGSKLMQKMKFIFSVDLYRPPSCKISSPNLNHHICCQNLFVEKKILFRVSRFLAPPVPHLCVALVASAGQ